ncbi:hypothetical protein PFICI_13251 [Pestalotiopsis fici W106-1]|uniref:galacturonan 1,4-alpha-galacturonidase n=1 Tax=Pestalotiopsis fici (strain W106-1 / CGMCC3.15140) TaxID=1229662 RepID=W3WNS6_PESFW|nr:uncharacterized protein PFICI_13251 [Pestalotiopsis fici W106-1]ETS74767.1 hypothetical protein PFICI_13251 [Pestalotiopsis fici W106-1]
MKITKVLLVTFTSLLVPSNAGGVNVTTVNGRPHCEVTANGDEINDVPNILEAFDECGTSGTITFPEDQEYWIAEKLNPFSDNITYWRNNSYPIHFQNHWAGFVLTGDHITIYGNGTGGVDGNGDVWYTEEAGSTQPGRPMPFVLWNVSNVVVEDFSIWQPQLWSFNIMNGTNISVTNLYVNATAKKAPSGYNWVQNTDGFDTMDVRNLTLRNLTYTGGDDCIAVKPRSYDILIDGVTCTRGNGIAIGSLGQYLEDSSVPNTKIGVYIKTWVGELVVQDNYESDNQPRGGGWGNVTNITLANFDVTGATRPFYIDQNNGNNGSDTKGTSNMLISDVYLRDFHGVLSGSGNTATLSCSKRNPCYNIFFDNMTETGSGGQALVGSCSNTEDDGIHGLSGC